MSEGSIRANPYSTPRTTVTAPDSPADRAADAPDRPPAPEQNAPTDTRTPAGPPGRGRARTTTRSLLPSLVPLLRSWLPRQRWFAGKGNPITGFSLVSATEILPCTAGGAAPGLLHLLVRAQQRPGTADCYQLLIGIRSTLPRTSRTP